MEKFTNNLHCLQPRLARKFAKKRSKYKPYEQFARRQYQLDDEEDEDDMNSLGKNDLWGKLDRVLIIFKYCRRLFW